MEVEHSNGWYVWVAPTPAIIASDIEKAQPQVRAGDRVIAIVLTDAGAQKLRDFTRAQMTKMIGLVVDGRLIWAPRVNAEFSKQTALTGFGPHGLTEEEVDRIMAALR